MVQVGSRASQGGYAALVADKEKALSLTPVSRETEARLDAFVALLLQWQAKTNLIAPSTLGQIWTRHIADSLQIVPLLDPVALPGLKTWIDLGSGGGFPGIVLAVALSERSPVTVHLVERNAKKAAFLREAARITGARAQIHLRDIGDFVDICPASPDYISARALASLDQLLRYIAPLAAPTTTALLMKGQDVDSELTEATRYWNFAVQSTVSLTDPSGRILQIRQIEPKDGKGRRS